MRQETDFEALKAERAALVNRIVSLPIGEAWQSIKQILLESRTAIPDEPLPTIYEGPTRSFLLPLPYEILKSFVGHFKNEALNLLFESSSDVNPLIAANSLFWLTEEQDSRVPQAVLKLAERQELIRSVCGCFVWEHTLSEFAQKKLSEYKDAQTDT